ncbi:MAG TPA: alpha/beta hydrolase [Armatimonadota bacterium]|nr:alpha/beta hydrolase [Armatimonadota bacterium]
MLLRCKNPEQPEALRWLDTARGTGAGGVEEVTLRTDRGEIVCRYHPAPGAVAGVVWVGGAGGGLDGPARGLYPEACRRLQRQGIAGLRLHYRMPNYLEDCVLDTLLGAEFLAGEGAAVCGLVGHSFGGAVVISAGALSERVGAIIPMSTQTYGTGLAPRVAPRPMLLVHGTADEVLPPSCSEQVYARAGEPKELVLYPGARHGLDEAREELLDLLVRWLPAHLRARETPLQRAA